MKAYEARAISYDSNKTSKGVTEIDKHIKDAAKLGLFDVDLLVYYSWGTSDALAEYYKQQGFNVTTHHHQTSPNDGDDYIHISWKEVK